VTLELLVSGCKSIINVEWPPGAFQHLLNKDLITVILKTYIPSNKASMIITNMTSRLSQIQWNIIWLTLFCKALSRYWVEDNDKIHANPQSTSPVARLTFEICKYSFNALTLHNYFTGVNFPPQSPNRQVWHRTRSAEMRSHELTAWKHYSNIRWK
jgi:hypothetical protein